MQNKLIAINESQLHNIIREAYTLTLRKLNLSEGVRSKNVEDKIQELNDMVRDFHETMASLKDNIHRNKYKKMVKNEHIFSKFFELGELEDDENGFPTFIIYDTDTLYHDELASIIRTIINRYDFNCKITEDKSEGLFTVSSKATRYLGVEKNARIWPR